MLWPQILSWLQLHALDLAVIALTALIASALAIPLRRRLHQRDLAHRPPTDDGGGASLPTITGWAARWLPVLLVTGATAAAIDLTDIVPLREFLAMVRTILATDLFQIQSVPITPMTAVVFAVIMLVTLQISSAARGGLARTLQRRGGIDAGTISTLQRLLHYAIIALGCMFALQSVGVNLSALFAASAVFAVGIGFGLQTIAKNFVAGIILLVERTIKPGDILTVDGMVVTVRELGIRATIAHTGSNDDLIIPNSLLVENTVINHSLDQAQVSASANVGVAYDSDVDEVIAALTRAAELTKSRVQHAPPLVLLANFGASTIDFTVYITVPSITVRGSTLSELRYHIWHVLRDAGISMAFPQIDVHLDRAALDALRRTEPHAP